MCFIYISTCLFKYFLRLLVIFNIDEGYKYFTWLGGVIPERPNIFTFSQDLKKIKNQLKYFMLKISSTCLTFI